MILKKLLKKKILRKKKSYYYGSFEFNTRQFSDGGKFNSFKKTNQRIKSMIDAGADIIDLWGESTIPGSKIISQKTELKRVKKIFEKLKKKFPKTLLSIDTQKSLVMNFSIKKKVDIINDVSCFRFDPKSFKLIKNKNLWKVIHHMQGTPQTMQINPSYDHVLLDIYDFFEKKISNFKSSKFSKKLILDPGMVLEKTWNIIWWF